VPGWQGLRLLKIVSDLRGLPLPVDTKLLRDLGEVDSRAARALDGMKKGEEEFSTCPSNPQAEWTSGAALGSRLADRFIKSARYREALEPLDQLRSQFPASIRVRQLTGLAHARLGHLQEGKRCLQEVYDEGHRDPETLSLSGRTYMDSYDRHGDRRELRRSRNLYLSAFWRLPSDYYPGINAASKSVFLGETKTAAKIAAKVQTVVTARLAEGSPDDWLLATDAELQLIAGNYQEAAHRYHAALSKMSREHLGSQFSTWLQAKRLMRAMRTGQKDRNQLWRAFQHLADSSPGPQVSQPSLVAAGCACSPSQARRGLRADGGDVGR